MVLWWIGNAVGLLVVIPLLLFLVLRLLRVVHEIDRYADDILDHGVRLTGTLDPLPALAQTEELTGAAKTQAVRYVGALRPLMTRD